MTTNIAGLDPKEIARMAGTAAGQAHAERHGRDDWNDDDEAEARRVEREVLRRLTA